MLDTTMFPPDVEYAVGEYFDVVKYNRRQVCISIDGSVFALVSCDYSDGKWQEPSFIVLRATVPQREFVLLHSIIDKVKVIMTHIGTPAMTSEEMEKFL